MGRKISAGNRSYSKPERRGDVERSIDRQLLRKDVEQEIRKDIEHLVRTGVIRDER